ncbi:MAG TPA: serine/threonine-protein kinase [Kofleriaceae bacterium]|nr:serine/threonine-protein kinase [Kofleriaceae bacterium]
MSAADTAMAAAAVAVSEPELRKTPGKATPGPARTSLPRSTPGFGNTDPDPTPDGEDPLIGTTLLGRYSVTRKIGQGGMGAVYEATHTLIGKRVAVKVLLDKYARKEQVVARLEQEARLASSIGHEHIIDITDFGTTDDGRTFVVMEFLEGVSLAECLHREGPLPETRILQISAQVGSALSAAHKKGVVHRDVKPENVFLLRRGDKDYVKVVDFGISKSLRQSDLGEEDSPRLTQTGMVLGTPLYMSPEQARGDEELDQRIDVYALGVIMYELATGRVPYTGTNYLSIISQVLNDEPVTPRELRPELSAEFEAVVLRAMDKDRDRRYQSTDDLVVDVNTLLEDPSRSTQRRRILPPRRASKRNPLRILAWVAGVSVVIAAVVVTVSMMMGGAARKPAAAIDAAASAAAVASDAAVMIAPIDAAPQTVTIYIDSKPSGAMIYWNSREVGKTPTTFEAPAENHEIDLVAQLDGYDDAQFTINPITDNKGKDKPITVRLIKTKQGAQPKHIIKKGTGPGTGMGTGTGTGETAPTGGGDLPDDPFRRGSAGSGK